MSTSNPAFSAALGAVGQFRYQAPHLQQKTSLVIRLVGDVFMQPHMGMPDTCESCMSIVVVMREISISYPIGLGPLVSISFAVGIDTIGGSMTMTVGRSIGMNCPTLYT